MVISSHYSHQEEQCILGFCCYYFYSPAKITCETFRICVCCLSPIGRSFSAPPICLNILPFCALGRLPTCPCLPSSSASASSEAVEVCCVCEDGRRKRGELTAPQEQPSATDGWGGYRNAPAPLPFTQDHCVSQKFSMDQLHLPMLLQG